MKISILSVFPELYDSFLHTSLLKRAQAGGLMDIKTESFFSYVEPKARIDAPTFGHGSGILIKPMVVQAGIEQFEATRGKALKVFFSPHGKKLDQDYLKQLYSKIVSQGHLMIVAGRYEGMDARVEQEYADELISIGDYVLMGGDLPAMVFLEALLRLIPGVVGKSDSVEHESFTGPFVDYPEYTEPVVWKEQEVPAIVRSGNHKALADWREDQALKRTLRNHFDWLRSYPLDDRQKERVKESIPHHYVALCHSEVLIGPERTVGTTSVTSIDIHDIARTSQTYGMKQFFIVTPLSDQQRITQTLLDFWQTPVGIEYNYNRHNALSSTNLVDTIDTAIARIKDIEGKDPVIVATTARTVDHARRITFFDQGEVWSLERPVLFVFGTGRGFSQDFLNRCDFILAPVKGLSQFNHLSVRSAVAIILDRWIGLQVKKRD